MQNQEETRSMGDVVITRDIHELQAIVQNQAQAKNEAGVLKGIDPTAKKEEAAVPKIFAVPAEIFEDF
jgi:hypothetical protein